MQELSLPTASDDYRQKRAALRVAEIALKEQRETVAALRRVLPTDTPVPKDYTFAEVDGDEIRKVRLFDLLSPDNGRLLVYHFMWVPGVPEPCPMCTMWTDGYNAVAPHVERSVPMVVITKQAPRKAREFADGRGWTNLRLLSSWRSSFNMDFGMETSDGAQLPGISVFVKDAAGVVRHFYTASAMMGGGHYRGLDLYSPVWNLLDLLPEGRGEFMPR